MRSRSITKTDPNYRHLLNRHIEKRPEIQHFSKLRGTFHNHPSGNPEPSSADKVLTQRLKEALGLVEVHMIVAGVGTVSFAERRLI
ncbi:JAB domain-containing protein [Pseudochelatococcus contaminans]|uniref:JAB domain-containing protein n=1 Tax=Pseudochelatococcus contaminans TaxID=1538103 RepID=UPI003D17710A